jgi:hypothetical protein
VRLPFRDRRHNSDADQPAPELDPDSLSAVLVCAAAATLRGSECHHPTAAAGRQRRRGVQLDTTLGRRRTFDETFPRHLGSVAAWITAHHPDQHYPAAVIGEPHGAAVHLATALGAVWLPTTVHLRAIRHLPDGHRRWPRDRHAARTAVHRWLAGMPVSDADVDGSDAGPSHRLPGAYRDFITRQLRPGASLIVVDAGGDAGSHQALMRRELADHGRTAGLAVHHLTYDRPAALSAAVADLYRQWLKRAGKTGNRLVIECGQLTDPRHVLRAGLVPYWCPRPSRTEVDLLQQWIAGSQPFTSIDALPEPTGTVASDLAPRTAWTAAVAFAQRRGVVDPLCRRAYPLGSVPRHHATTVLKGHPNDQPRPPSLNPVRALDTLRDSDVRVVRVR